MTTVEKYLNQLIGRCFSYGLIEDFQLLMNCILQYPDKCKNYWMVGISAQGIFVPDQKVIGISDIPWVEIHITRIIDSFFALKVIINIH